MRSHHHRHHHRPPHCKRGYFPRHRSRRRSLFWRVFRHGILLIVLAALAAGTVSYLNRDASWWERMPQAMGTWLGSEWVASQGDHDTLQRQLAALEVFHSLHVTVFGQDGEMLGTNVDPPHPPADAETLAALDQTRRRRRVGMHDTLTAPMDVDGQRVGYLRLSFPEQHPPLWKPLMVLMAILGVIALVSWPLARHLTAPVAALTSTIQAFGAGDLGARVRSKRKDEVGDLARAFDAMADDLQSLILSQKELLANVSHELRTPLARIRVAVELAEDDGGDDQGYLAEITEDLHELERMLEDVLTTARLDLAEGRAGSSTHPLRVGPVDAVALATEAASRFNARWPEGEAHLDTELTQAPLEGDAVLLRRVVDNLLDNARKYSGDSAPITLRVLADDNGIAFEVEDQGVGIAEDDLAQLFEPFFRVDRSRTRGTGGVGLGLALARRVVTAHGGTIEASSEVGHGTTIRFVIPLAPPA